MNFPIISVESPKEENCDASEAIEPSDDVLPPRPLSIEVSLGAEFKSEFELGIAFASVSYFLGARDDFA